MKFNSYFSFTEGNKVKLEAKSGGIDELGEKSKTVKKSNLRNAFTQSLESFKKLGANIKTAISRTNSYAPSEKNSEKGVKHELRQLNLQNRTSIP